MNEAEERVHMTLAALAHQVIEGDINDHSLAIDGRIFAP
jgi:hypothetical protein